jgi:hypothetical protein
MNASEHMQVVFLQFSVVLLEVEMLLFISPLFRDDVLFRRLFWAACLLLSFPHTKSDQHHQSPYVRGCENLRAQNQLLRSVIALEAQMPIMVTKGWMHRRNTKK